MKGIISVFIDADACPVVDIAVFVSSQYEIKPFLFCDTSHLIEREAIVNAVSKFDIVVTQDYGLAAMCLAKGAFVLNQNGKEFTDENIDQMLFFRHENAKFRRAGGKTKGPKKRTEKNNLDFEIKFRQICERAMLLKKENDNA